MLPALLAVLPVLRSCLRLVPPIKHQQANEEDERRHNVEIHFKPRLQRF